MLLLRRQAFFPMTASGPQTSLKICPSTEALEPVLRNEKAGGARIVMCHGVFDVLHPGHLAHLNEAKTYGEVLVVCVTDDRFVNKGPGRPLFSLYKRMAQLAALQVVDHVVGVSASTCAATITTLKPDYYVRGPDHTSDTHPLSLLETEACEKAGTRRRFTNADPDSSTRVSARAFSMFPDSTEGWLQDFRNRHTLDEVLSWLQRIKGLRVLVVGHREQCIFNYVEPYAQIPEGYAPATKVIRTTQFEGAGKAVLQHCLGFVQEGQMLSQEVPVTEEIYLDADSSRFLFMAQTQPPDFWLEGEELDFESTLESAVSQVDVVIVSDYGLGLITPEIQAILESQAKFLAATVKAYHANLGFNEASKYARMDYFCLNELEHKLAVSRSPRFCESGRVMITRGKHGSDYRNHHTPTFALDVVDTVGCGDAVLALTAPLIAAGTPTEIVNFLGQAVAAIQCTIPLNTKPAAPEVLGKQLKMLLA